MKRMVILALFASLTACEKSPTTEPSSHGASQNHDLQTQPSTPSNTIVIPKQKLRTLQEVITITKPKMGDVDDGSVNAGAAILAWWGSDAMKWNELQSLPDAQYEEVIKTPDEQRGKKICTSGKIIEIAVDNNTPQRLHTGSFHDDKERAYRFIAIKSSDKVVQDSSIRFCGVVIGQESYQNTGNGVTNAVSLVGMFDLPENKAY